MSQREKFVRCAREQIGKQYVWGTAGPNTFDCSGLVSYCYEQTTDEPMTRSSHQQYLLGNPVPRNQGHELGDLLFWDTSGDGAGHVAIYAGDGKVVHALNPERDVVESLANAPMGGPYLGARRLDWRETDNPPKARRRRRRTRPRQ